MLATNLAGRLSGEDLVRWRQLSARTEAIEVAPQAYSAREIEETFMRKFVMLGEFEQTYELDGARRYSVSVSDGTIVYGDWSD